jgi:hypothetical protein
VVAHTARDHRREQPTRSDPQQDVRLRQSASVS